MYQFSPDSSLLNAPTMAADVDRKSSYKSDFNWVVTNQAGTNTADLFKSPVELKSSFDSGSEYKNQKVFPASMVKSTASKVGSMIVSGTPTTNGSP